MPRILMPKQGGPSAKRAVPKKRRKEITSPKPLYDVAAVERLLQGRARQGKDISYSEALGFLGHRFTRPKMRALCAVLSAVDERAAARGQPEIAVLVTRASDHIPGQGWWIDRHAYQGPWKGDTALAYVQGIQRAAFRYWAKRK